MNVLMIHGIAQEGSTKDELLSKWLQSLHSAAPGLLDKSAVEMAYFGTTLANWANGSAKTAISMGIDSAEANFSDASEMNFVTSALQEAFIESGGNESDIEAALQESGGNVVPMDNFVSRRLVGIVRALERISPAKGSILLRVITQAYTYLSVQGAASAVDSLVRPLLKKSPQVLITHSLGTVVAFKLLREMEALEQDIDIPLLITMGSPLGLDAVKKKLGPPRRKPSMVKRWANFYDPSDFVALGKNLDQYTFAAGIENDGTVDNSTSNAHGIVGYLPHRGFIEVLKSVL